MSCSSLRGWGRRVLLIHWFSFCCVLFTVSVKFFNFDFDSRPINNHRPHCADRLVNVKTVQTSTVHRCVHRTGSFIPDRTDHVVCSHTYPRGPQVGGVEDCGSTTHVFTTWRSDIHRRSSPCLEQSPALTSCDRLR